MQTVKELDKISINLKLEYKNKSKIHVHKVSDMIKNRVQFQWQNLFIPSRTTEKSKTKTFLIKIEYFRSWLMGSINSAFITI